MGQTEEQNTIINHNYLLEKTTLSSGKYVILSRLGEGGFGITYKAMQVGLNKIVCIKEYFLAGRCVRRAGTPFVEIQGDNTATYMKYQEAFVKEARMLSDFHHPNIVNVTDVFSENNTSYMVMDFIEGMSLQKIVDDNGPLSYPQAVNYMAQIASAVGYVHQRHVLHRDIKPDNIMITADHKAILIDFGSAREFEHDKTQAHTSMITHGYAPTEQYTTKSRKGSYTDIYAIGATLYFVLTGQVPMESAARLTEKMTEPRALNYSIPPEANRTILKAMQIKAENRHQTIDEFMDDLRNVKPSKLVDENIGGGSRGKAWILAVVGIAVVLVGGLLAYLFMGFGSNSQDILELGAPDVEIYNFSGEYKYPMIYVEGGDFVMGSDDADSDDNPRHSVTISDFYIGQMEVSRGLYKQIMGINADPSGSEPETTINGEVATDAYYDMLPVENISYDDAKRFIAKLNKKTGADFMLPTEAQWEYAARGGKYSKGTRYAGSMDVGGIWYNQNDTAPVDYDGNKNELGIYNMSGNVAEWCADFYDENYYNESAGMVNPYNGEEMSKDVNCVVFRGGGYDTTDTSELTTTYRDFEYQDDCRPSIGIRLVINK